MAVADEPLVYVIVLNWNGKEETLECLESLQRVDYGNFRVLVVDNASTDGSVEVVGERYPEVEIIENSENLRYSGGNNVGIAQAMAHDADYVLLLNNDTVVDPSFLGRLVSAAAGDEKRGIIGAKIRYYGDRDLIWYAGGRVDFARGGISHRGIRYRDNGEFDKGCATDYVTGCCMLIARPVIEEIGGLDEGYYIYTEDADYCHRAGEAGFICYYEPSARIWHKVSSSSGGGLTPFKVYHRVRSNFRFFARHARWYHWLTIPFFVGGRGLVFALDQLLHGNREAVGALLRGGADLVLGRGEHAEAGRGA